MKKSMQTVARELADVLGEEFIVTAKDVTKNNGTVRNGIQVEKKGTNIAPIIYSKEGETIEDLKSRVKEAFECFPGGALETLLGDPEGVRDNLVYSLVNTKANEEQLADWPHRAYADLSVIYKVLVNKTNTVTVTNALAASWRLSEDELWELANTNTPRLCPMTVQPMGEVLMELMGDGSAFASDPASPLTIISNRSKVHGAAAVLYPAAKAVLKSMGEVYIIPSSIHELLAIPRNVAPDYDTVCDMIREINAAEVMPEEVLSDHPYIFVDGRLQTG